MVVIVGFLFFYYILFDFKELLRIVKVIGVFFGCDNFGEYLKLVVEMGVDFIKLNEDEVIVILDEMINLLEENVCKLVGKIFYLVVLFGVKGLFCVYNGKLY